MKALILLTFFGFYALVSTAQIKADSLHIYYGMTQSAPTEPLMDYIENLETSGAKSIRIKKADFDKIQDCFKGVKEKKYKGEKHKGTVYFVVIYSGGNRQFGAFDSSLEGGKFINLSTKQINTITDKAMMDKLYYLLLQIH